MVLSENRKNLLAILFLVFVIGIFFWDLVTLKSAFLSGDHREQQYPWAKFYQSQIQQGHMPWWTTHIHSGFPILAEGQIGAFYPVNYLTFRFLPAKTAYNYGILLHYVLAAVFFFSYLRLLKLSAEASLFGSLLFLFGSTQGGYFYYNYISQKVVIWLPLSLFLIEKLLKQFKWQTAFWLSLVFACKVFGGYLQVAVYSLFFAVIYFLIRWFQCGRPLRPLLLFGASCALMIVMTLVQILPTFELALFSSRAGAAKDIAYIGSMTPLGWLTLFYPSWDGFLGSEWYAGILGLFCFIWSFSVIKHPMVRTFLGLMVLFLLLALGEWSPLYRLLIETTGFSSFRTPIKFLFFVTFSMTVLAAYGWDAFWNQVGSKLKANPTRIFFILAAAAILIPPAADKALALSRPKFMPWFEKAVVQKFHGKPGHPHEEATYREKARQFVDAIQDQLSVQKNKHTRIELLILLGACLLIFRAGIIPQRSTGKMVLILFTLLDLYAYSFTSIKPGWEPFNTIDEPATEDVIISYLKKDLSQFRITELYSAEAEKYRFPIFPSINMIYGIDDLGAYSPLVTRPYKEFLQGWGGYINDSLSTVPVTKDQMLSRLRDLQTLNVKYILSREALSHELLSNRFQADGVWLYELASPQPRAFISTLLPQSVSNAAPLTGARVTIQNNRQQQSVRLNASAPQEGFLLLSELHYPGWNVSVNGKRQELLKWGGVFRAVSIPAGESEIIFNYSTARFQFWGFLSLILAMAGAAAAIIPATRKP